MRERALHFIAVCSEPKKLEQMIRNARYQGEPEVERAAMLRLYEVKPEAFRSRSGNNRSRSYTHKWVAKSG